MSFRIRRILVAIRDEPLMPKGALRKAAAIARANGARIELFHAINEPEALDALRHGYIAGRKTDQITAAIQKRSTTRLAKLAARSELKGLKVTSTAAWDFPPHEAV